MNTSKLKAFVTALPSKATSELFTLLFDHAQGRLTFFDLVASDVEDAHGKGYVESNRRMSEASIAIRAEIDHRIPARQGTK